MELLLLGVVSNCCRVLGDGRRARGEAGAKGWRQNGKFGRNRMQNLIRRWKRSKVEGKIM